MHHALTRATPRRLLRKADKSRLFDEQRIDHIDHGRRISPGVIIRQTHRVEAIRQPLGRMVENTVVGTAKAIDGLLRIAHQKNRRPIRVRLVGRQPGQQNAPLHRVGVLELVEQQVAVSGIQPRLQVRSAVGVIQQTIDLDLKIGVVHQTPLTLEGFELGEQRGAGGQRCGIEFKHTQLQPRGHAVEQGAGKRFVQHQEIGFARLGQAPRLRLGRFAYAHRPLAGQKDRHQRLEAWRVIGDGQGIDQGIGGFLVGGRVLAQIAGVAQEPRLEIGRAIKHRQCFFVRGHFGRGRHIRQHRFKRRPRGKHLPLTPPRHEGVEEAARIGAAEQGVELPKRSGRGTIRRLGAATREQGPGLVHERAFGLGQRKAGQPGVETGARQNAAKPAVKCGDGDRRAGLLDRFDQTARPRQDGKRLRRVEPARFEKSAGGGVIEPRQVAQPQPQPRFDLPRRLAGVRNGKDVAGACAGEQNAQDARHQQPGLATAGAGLDHHAARRVQRLANEGLSHRDSPCGTDRAHCSSRRQYPARWPSSARPRPCVETHR